MFYEQDIYLRKDFGITIIMRGMLANAEYKIDPLKSKLNKSVFIQAINFLDYNGDVLMCSHDWGKKYLGNLKSQKFLDIWLSQKTQSSRNQLISGDRSLSPCDVCDVHGDLIGKKL